MTNESVNQALTNLKTVEEEKRGIFYQKDDFDSETRDCFSCRWRRDLADDNICCERKGTVFYILDMPDESDESLIDCFESHYPQASEKEALNNAVDALLAVSQSTAALAIRVADDLRDGGRA